MLWVGERVVGTGQGETQRRKTAWRKQFCSWVWRRWEGTCPGGRMECGMEEKEESGCMRGLGSASQCKGLDQPWERLSRPG